MEKKSFTVLSDFDQLPLHGEIFIPDTQPIGVVQILHGMCEYAERYYAFMEHFCREGFVMVCYDQRGHGDSVLQKEDRGYFYETKGRAIVEDAAQITRYIKAEFPNLPITLFGHSMGSMVARCYLQRYDTLIDKAVISGSPAKNPLCGVAIALTKLIALFCGKRHRSKMLTYLSTGKGNNKFPGEGKGAWLNSNRENVNAFYAHPKGGFRFTCNGFLNLFRLMKNTYDNKLYQVQNPTLPIYFISGADDAVLGGEKNFEKAMQALRTVGYQNVDGKLYAGLRHEAHNEINNGEVLSNLLAQFKR